MTTYQNCQLITERYEQKSFFGEEETWWVCRIEAPSGENRLTGLETTEQEAIEEAKRIIDREGLQYA